MFVLSNSYELKDIKKDIFSLFFDMKTPVSFFISMGDYHAFSSKSELFSLKDGKVKKIAGFKAEITCLTAHEGLLCAGTLNGEIQIFTEHRTAIRQFKNKDGAEITDIVITPEKTVITTSKDASINLYDLKEDKLLHDIKLQDDFAKKLLITDDKILAFTRSIEIYSLKDYTLLNTIKTEKRTDLAISIPESTVLFTSNNKAYLLNLKDLSIAPGRFLHTKMITSLMLYDGKIYSSSLDGHMKSFSTSLKLINDFNLNEKLVSFSIENGIPTVATENGKVYSIRKEKTVAEQRRFVSRENKYDERISYDIIQSNKRTRTKIDNHLINYEYKDALRACFINNKLDETYSVLKHISDKRSLMKLIKDSDLEFLKNILQLCVEVIKIREFTPLVSEMLVIITSLYSDDIIENESLKELICCLSNEINEMVAFEEMFLRTLSFAESFPTSE